MTRIVTGGLPPDVVSSLRSQLHKLTVTAAETGAEVLEALGGQNVSLLILDHNVENPSPADVLRQLRATSRLTRLPVVYCLDNDLEPELPGKLVREFGVAQVLFRPLDREELCRQVASILGVPVRAGAPSPEKQQHIVAGVARVWEHSAPAVAERLDVLEHTGVALLEGKLSPALRQRSEQEAHKLAGLLGTLGLAAGSRFAVEMEHILRRGSRLAEPQALRFSELVLALRLELERAPAGSGFEHPSAEPAEQAELLLVAVSDPDLAEQLAAEAASRGMRVKITARLDAAREIVAELLPDVVLLDLALGEGSEQGLELLAELSSCVPPIPVLVLTARGSFTDRVEVARRGGRGFLSKSLPPGQIVDAIAELLLRVRARKTRVMAVDDDPEVLLVLRELLEGRGISLTTLDNPLRFWEAFARSEPELLVLDVEMPHLSGIELCRVVRNDASHAAVPVIFLTAHTDAETVHRVFTAGADDFVGKPIVGPELVTRIFNRLERSRLHRSMAEIDPLTGVANRRKSFASVEQFLRLSDRHEEPLSLGVLSLDAFGQVNLRHGHAAADDVLRCVGQLLKRAFRSEDVVGRWGGGEFVIGMYGLSRYDGVQRLAEVLEALRQERFRSALGAEFGITFSAGVAEYPEDGADLQALYRAAGEAAGQGSAAGGNRVLPVGWSPEQQQKLRHVDVALVMGDEAEASLLVNALETRGYRTRWLRNGSDAARALGGWPPKLQARVIVLDADISGLDGLELLRRLQRDGCLEHSRAIMVTAPSVGDDAAAALRLGALDHVAKPFSLPVMIQHVRRALEAQPVARYSRRPPEASSANEAT